MDALQLLRDDHRRVKELFRQFSEADDASTRKAIVDEAIAELMVHAQLEEEIFYPAMQRAGYADLIGHAEEEHHAAETIMNELVALDARDGTLAGRFTALVDSVREHIDEEESQIFPRAAELGMERLENLGDELQERRTAIMRAPARQAPQRRTTGTRSATTRKRTTARATTTRAKAATTRVKATTTARKTANTARKATTKAATTARKTASKAATGARKSATTARKTAATGARKTATTARKTATQAASGVRKTAATASRAAKSTARSTTARAKSARSTTKNTTAGSRK